MLLKRYEELGEKFDPSKFKSKPAIRINTLKASKNKLVFELERKKIKLQKIDFLEDGYYYKSNFALASTPEYLKGLFYMQEAASQIPVQELNPLPGDVVLDMAASPGSKTSQMAQKMNNEGIILAIDIDNQRISKLRFNLERLSIKNTVIIQMDARKVHKLKKEFDKILLDAPCSGNYCIDKDFFNKRNTKDFQNRSWLQKELLESAYSSLKKGGTLVYSTCSLEPEENEIVIDWFLKEHKDMKLQKINTKIGDFGITNPFGKELNKEISKTRRLWPHKTNTQGFFIAKLIKS